MLVNRPSWGRGELSLDRVGDAEELYPFNRVDRWNSRGNCECDPGLVATKAAKRGGGLGAV
jgi:hypothetical protein